MVSQRRATVKCSTRFGSGFVVSPPIFPYIREYHRPDVFSCQPYPGNSPQLRVANTARDAMSSTVAKILEQAGCLSLPGVFDAYSARLAERAGFPLAFVSGYSVAATSLGVPDFGLLTQTEIVAQAARICRAVKIPVLIDADTGYGNPLNVRRTVEELIAAGAAGCFLEDQVWPKRCGHLQGKTVIAHDEFLEKIRAAVDARGDADFFLVARSDALAVEGLDEAISRVQAARDLGADASFVEAPLDLRQLETIGRSCRAPNVANMIAGGKTPSLGHDQLRELGFQLILHPLCGLAAVADALQTTFAHLHEHRQPPPGNLDFAALNQIVDLPKFLEREQKYASTPSSD